MIPKSTLVVKIPTLLTMAKTFLIALALVVCSIVYPLTDSRAQGTAFTYQGRLNDGSTAAAGVYDLRFTVFDGSESGTAITGAATNSAVLVTNGLFSVALDFG